MSNDPQQSAWPDTQNRDCPLCLRPFGTLRRRPAVLYNTLVCSACRNSLVNRRQLAWVIDRLLRAGLDLLLVGLIMGYGSAATFGPDPLTTIMMGLPSAVLFFPFKDAFQGCSPGKLLCGLRVVDVWSREPITIWASVKRNLPFVVPYLGALVEGLSLNSGQRWGDRLARSMVIRTALRHRAPFARACNLCIGCGYDLTGNVTGVCPECGRAVRTGISMVGASEATGT